MSSHPMLIIKYSILKLLIFLFYFFLKKEEKNCIISLLKVKSSATSNSSLILLLIRATSLSNNRPDKVNRDGGIYSRFKSLNKSIINGFSITSKGIPAITHAFNKV